MDSDIDFMRYALGEAQQALEEGEVPVGAVLVVGGEVVASVHNARESTFDPTAHAEVLALRKAAQALRSWRLNNATLYVTKEPCPMCAGAMVNARLGRLVYGCGDPKGGAVESLYRILSDPRLNHQVEVISGVLGEESAALLKSFFRDRRGGAAFPRKL
ncbi:MAG: tRNA adenosine(34) deaminase TadA [Alphaproteobacteria bacterium]|uniref:tRNA-specific adenosine deaminase n=1 Tax=Candidatus Nitrobium versatile TaxID=2884831 RepID=A0A953JAM8_9BACT|nr:tRNA adenosine(34) deaminase TadA [Candidatus Nitrobium versatile]